MDLSAVPKDQRQLWELHVRLMDRHVHQSYSGDAVLFRTATHALGSSCDDASGWRDFVRGTLDVRIVPGSHESVLTESHAKVLADILQSCLVPYPRREPRATGSPFIVARQRIGRGPA